MQRRILNLVKRLETNNIRISSRLITPKSDTSKIKHDIGLTTSDTSNKIKQDRGLTTSDTSNKIKQSRCLTTSDASNKIGE